MGAGDFTFAVECDFAVKNIHGHTFDFELDVAQFHFADLDGAAAVFSAGPFDGARQGLGGNGDIREHHGFDHKLVTKYRADVHENFAAAGLGVQPLAQRQLVNFHVRLGEQRHTQPLRRHIIMQPLRQRLFHFGVDRVERHQVQGKH